MAKTLESISLHHLLCFESIFATLFSLLIDIICQFLLNVLYSHKKHPPPLAHGNKLGSIQQLVIHHWLIRPNCTSDTVDIIYSLDRWTIHQQDFKTPSHEKS